MKRTGIPKLYHKLYERAASGKASPRAAIKMFCAECCGYERNEVTLCTDTGCPLRSYRPFQARPKCPPESCQTPDLRGFETVGSTNSENKDIG